MNGLTRQEVQYRFENGLVNYRRKKTTRSYKEIIFSSIFTYFNAVNAFLFILLLLIQSYQNLLFFVVVISNSIVQIVQEIRAKQMLDRLEIMIENKVTVFRDGSTEVISIYELVLDDLFVCKDGMQIPVDAFVQHGQLEVNESLLTGEIKPQLRVEQEEIFSGTFVVSGEAVCKVRHVGKDNRCEKIIAVGQEIKHHDMELKKSLDKMIRIVGLFLIPVGFLVFYSQRYFLKVSYSSAIVQTTSAVIGMIPSGLVFLTSIALVVSVLRLGKRKILVQELHSVETLSRANVICLDKTGTLTQGIHQVDFVKSKTDKLSEIMGSYCRVFPSGNATNQAMCLHFRSNHQYTVKNKLPFSSSRKYSAITFDQGTYYLGAYQFLFPNGDKETEEAIRGELEKGYRLIVLAHSAMEIQEEIPPDLQSIGWIFIKDKVRENAAETIQYFKNQEIECKVFSGDDPRTVSRVASEAGIENAERWVDASKYSMEELKLKLEDHAVFGRLLPEQKMELIEELQFRGKVVAMVGDGINDIPALKKANLSIALGNGSDATKNIANMVLLDSEFSVFPQIVQEGRRVMNNLGNASSMFLIKTIFSMILVALTIIISAEYPFYPIQLTIIGTFAVGVPTFLLQFESSDKRVQGNFLRNALLNALPSALFIAIGALGIIFLRRSSGYSPSEMSSAIMIQTGILYTMSLYVIYAPLTKLRVLVILMMQLGMMLSFYILSSLLQLVLLPQSLLIPLVLYVVSCSCFLFYINRKKIKGE